MQSILYTRSILELQQTNKGPGGKNKKTVVVEREKAKERRRGEDERAWNNIGVFYCPTKILSRAMNYLIKPYIYYYTSQTKMDPKKMIRRTHTTMVAETNKRHSTLLWTGFFSCFNSPRVLIFSSSSSS